MTGSEEANPREFLAEAEEILEVLAESLLSLEAGPAGEDPDPEVINSIFRGAHSLKGIAGMFGLAQVTDVAHKTETLLDAVRMGRVSCRREVVDLLFQALDLLRALCARLASGQPAEDPRVEAFVEQLQVASGGGPEQEANPLSALDLPEEAVQVLTGYEIHRIEETLGNPKRTLAKVGLCLPLDSFDTDLEAFNARLAPCAEIISTLPTTAATGGDRIGFDLIVGAKVAVEQLRDLAEQSGATVTLLEPSQEPGGVTAEVATPAPAPEERPATGPGDAELRSLTKTIRVDLPKLDSLMNLVGELVLSKGRIQMASERLRQELGFAGEVLELTKAQKELERKLAELQQSVMDVRMVPMGQLFSKLHRVVRKILHGSNKQVDLEIVGAETELDKLIVEDLSDPLVHVLRNAVDHGIEEPEERQRRGKPPRGTVRIAARQRGNHVVIEVSDDGRGLSVGKIREVAIEKGLVAAGAEVEERELFDLVFLPGFSTRDQVTEISGRGVGMDVVAKNIGALSGMIELDSREGRGTTLTIILPITLAIIQALLAEVSGQTYAFPLNSVLETLAVEPPMVKALEGRPMLRLRDSTMPLVQVGQLFGGGAVNGLPAFAVVVGVAEKRVAFGVDDLVRQQDVVIKGLGRRLEGVRGVAGATDLGDQRTILVLDVAALVGEVYAVD